VQTCALPIYIFWKDSWFPSATHGMATAAHEDAWRLDHIVRKLRLRPVNDRVAVLVLQLEAKLLSLRGQLLFQVLVGLGQFLFLLVLVNGGEIDLGILHVGIFRG